ncbi:hypothetical protein CCMSSC00406_0001704 [Pleurotus cornucopiae]|uniref:Uncharacterized protein n=1 Tax=Pleurotus cornucopiae TaxID=5321 RepID=A0ACB7IP92_PLECO|nr:hypothetical protein CCMSSC00406_0001704 [Pleurotus cornucopiae]
MSCSDPVCPMTSPPLSEHAPKPGIAPPPKAHSSPDSAEVVFQAWLASRAVPRAKTASYLFPGAQRQFSAENFRLAYRITQECAYDLFFTLWSLHPIRATIMMAMNMIRSLLPAFRGYSQAMLIDELQSLVVSGHFTWYRIGQMLFMEVLRRVIEGLLDSLAATNESLVLNSVRFHIEHQQLSQRVRLDLPTLSDPFVRELLQESDLFARSFHVTGNGFGLLSPLEAFRVLSLIAEIASHLWVIYSLTHCTTHVCVLIFSSFPAAFPLLMAWLGPAVSFGSHGHATESDPWSFSNQEEAQASERQEKLRNLAYNDSFRPEVELFGLGPWILHSWSAARKVLLGAEQRNLATEYSVLANLHVSELFSALQHIPLIIMLQTSSASLGSVTLYRSSIQSVVFATRNLLSVVRMAFQGVFLMGAFYAAMNIKPRLQPKKEDIIAYKQIPGGAKIDVRGLSYTYPGSNEPALRDVNFTLQAGETLAIVGHNGSGKSTLANILLRIVDFSDGQLLVNDVDIRRYAPAEYHDHVTAVFQGFSKFSTTVQENVGLGFVPHVQSPEAVNHALELADADGVVNALPKGLQTKLESSVYDPVPFGGPNSAFSPSTGHHGLSGGEWQRVAVARAFMRARQPGVDLLLFDEPTSSLDAHAQNHVFNTIANVSKDPVSGARTKSVIFITHRLSTARRADKVAMMENGTISEFGSHEELLRKQGSYAALYDASV